MEIFRQLELTRLKVAMLTTESSGDFAVYHQLMAEEFKKEGIDLVNRELLPRRDYLPNGYKKVRQQPFCRLESFHIFTV